MQSSFRWAGAPALPSCGIWRLLLLKVNSSDRIHHICFVPPPPPRQPTQVEIRHWCICGQVGTLLRRPPTHGAPALYHSGQHDLWARKKEVMPPVVADSDVNNGFWSGWLEVLLLPHAVRKWSPNGLGKQPLYLWSVSMCRRDDDSVLLSQKSVTVSFRSVLLMEQPVTEATEGGFSLFFKEILPLTRYPLCWVGKKVKNCVCVSDTRTYNPRVFNMYPPRTPRSSCALRASVSVCLCLTPHESRSPREKIGKAGNQPRKAWYWPRISPVKKLEIDPKKLEVGRENKIENKTPTQGPRASYCEMWICMHSTCTVQGASELVVERGWWTKVP